MSDQIHFKNPPVVEVVIGVVFKEINALRSGHMGLFWKEIISDYPKYEDRKILQDPKAISIELGQAAERIRSFYVNDEEDRLIQLQHNRFYHNWRKKSGKSYPKFAEVKTEFIKRFDQFKKFLEENNLGSVSEERERLEIESLEVTYVDEIPRGELWSELTDINSILPITVGYTNLSSGDTLKPVTWKVDYPIEEFDGIFSVHLRLVSDEENEPSTCFLHSTLRGSKNSDESVEDWLLRANEFHVKWFVSAVTDKAKQIWGLKND